MRQIFAIVFVLFLIPIGYSYAQEVSEQVTLSGDLANDPIAQDILKKIELTKQWIAELQQRDYEKTQAQKELEEKRAIALDRLNQDLKEWEMLWANYTSRAAFERFVEGKPAQVQGVFWDSFEFKEMKIKAGRDALKKVIAEGGSLREARAAYLEAAETKRIELIEANAQFNVKHGLAYYKQQLLFNAEGKFIDSPDSFETLSKYYSDYRADPAYYAANLDDKFSYEDFGTTTQYTQCREGFTVVHRFQSNDYVCVTIETAEMWVRHGVGEILGVSISSLQEENTNTPLTQCAPGFKVVYVVGTQRYSCVTESTADEWIESKVADAPKIEDYVFADSDTKPVSDLILEINMQIQKLNDQYELDRTDLVSKYNKMYSDAEGQSRQAEKDAISNYHSNSTMTSKDLSDQLIEIRKALDNAKDNILDEKEDSLKDLKKQYDEDVLAIRLQYNESGDVDIIWNDSIGLYEAVPIR